MTEWSYLLSPSFRLRQVLAAHLVENCPNVIEIGSYRSPISNFMKTSHTNVVLIDPRLDNVLPNDRIFNLVPIKSSFHVINPEPYFPFALVALGVDVEEGLSEDFVNWCGMSSFCVLEYPPDWERSVQLINKVVSDRRKRVVLQADLDLTGNDFGDLSQSWHVRPKRRLVVFQ